MVRSYSSGGVIPRGRKSPGGTHLERLQRFIQEIKHHNDGSPWSPFCCSIPRNHVYIRHVCKTFSTHPHPRDASRRVPIPGLGRGLTPKQFQTSLLWVHFLYLAGKSTRCFHPHMASSPRPLTMYGLHNCPDCVLCLHMSVDRRPNREASRLLEVSGHTAPIQQWSSATLCSFRTTPSTSTQLSMVHAHASSQRQFTVAFWL